MPYWCHAIFWATCGCTGTIVILVLMIVSDHIKSINDYVNSSGKFTGDKANELARKNDKTTQEKTNIINGLLTEIKMCAEDGQFSYTVRDTTDIAKHFTKREFKRYMKMYRYKTEISCWLDGCKPEITIYWR